MLINSTRICSTLVLFDRLNVLITIRSYNLVVSQDLLDLISKYKILLQKKKIKSNNIITLLRIFCFLSKINVLKIMLLRINLFYKFWNVIDEIETLIVFEAKLYIDLLAYAIKLNNTIYFLASHAFITTIEGSF